MKIKKDIPKIINKLNEILEKSGQEYLRPVEANAVLESAGLLNDSATRKGKPLRELLRKGLIPHAIQPRGKSTDWFIPHSKGKAIKI